MSFSLLRVRDDVRILHRNRSRLKGLYEIVKEYIFVVVKRVNPRCGTSFGK